MGVGDSKLEAPPTRHNPVHQPVFKLDKYGGNLHYVKRKDDENPVTVRELHHHGYAFHPDLSKMSEIARAHGEVDSVKYARKVSEKGKKKIYFVVKKGVADQPPPSPAIPNFQRLDDLPALEPKEEELTMPSPKFDGQQPLDDSKELPGIIRGESLSPLKADPANPRPILEDGSAMGPRESQENEGEDKLTAKNEAGADPSSLLTELKEQTGSTPSGGEIPPTNQENQEKFKMEQLSLEEALLSEAVPKAEAAPANPESVPQQQQDSEKQGTRESEVDEEEYDIIDMWDAARDNDSAKIRECLKQGVDPNQLVGLHNQTVLHCAAGVNAVDVMKVLLEEGKMDPNFPDQIVGGTALHHAGEYGGPDVVPLLVKHGVEIDKLDLLGDTALEKARVHDKPETYRALIAVGANPDLRNPMNA